MLWGEHVVVAKLSSWLQHAWRKLGILHLPFIAVAHDQNLMESKDLSSGGFIPFFQGLNAYERHA